MGFPNIWNSIPRPNLTHLATYICVYMCACACMHAGECGRGRTHTYTYIHTHTRTLVWVHTHTRVYTYMCIYPTHSVTSEFDKHLKKAGRHIGRNIVEITIKMKTITRKPLMIKIPNWTWKNSDRQLNIFASYTDWGNR